MILAGHSKLRNDLRRPTMEEIGYRTDIFTLDVVAGSQREYILWLLGASSKNPRRLWACGWSALRGAVCYS